MVVRDLGYNHVITENKFGTEDFIVKDCPHCPLYPYQTPGGVKFVECMNRKCEKRKVKKGQEKRRKLTNLTGAKNENQ